MMIKILVTDSTVQKNVKQQMNARGWSRRRLAREAKLSQSTVSDFFVDGHQPRPATVEAIGKAFKIPVSQLYEPGIKRTELSEEESELLLVWHCLDGEDQSRFLGLMYSCRKTTQEERVMLPDKTL